MIELLGRVYALSACHAVIYQLEDPEAGNLLQQIIIFEKEYKELLNEYASNLATVASLEPDNKVKLIDPNVLGLQVWQSTKDKVNSKILTNASVKHDKEFVASKSSNVEDPPSVHDKQVSSRKANLDSRDANDTKRPDKFSSNKTYHSTDKKFAKNDIQNVNITKSDYQKINNAKLTHHGCFICGADNQLIGDGHQCNTDYKNRDGKRSF